MEKPITVLREEFIEGVVELCNNSGLPAFAKADILKKITKKLNVLATNEYNDDKKQYESAQEHVEESIIPYTGEVKIGG